MRGAEVGPLAQVGFAEEHHSGLAEFLCHERIASGNGPGQGQRSGGGAHPVTSVQIVLDQHRHTVQRTARSFGGPLSIQGLSNGQRIRVKLNHGVERRAVLIDLLNARQIFFRERDRAESARLHP